MSRTAITTRVAAGFTLIEVLVALVLVAFGMGAVLASLSSAANSTAALREKTLADWVGLNQLATVRLNLQLPAIGSSEGDVDDYAGGRWHWQQEVEDQGIPGIKRITVRVRRIVQETTASSQQSWLATIVGFRGDALASANGELPDWSGTPFGGGTGTAGTAGGTGSSAQLGIGNNGTSQSGSTSTSTGDSSTSGGSAAPPGGG
jgi:general secretion pathway protein I